MTLFQVGSALNIVGISIAIWRMSVVARRYSMPKVWESFFFGYYVFLFLSLITQFYAFYISTGNTFIIKAASILSWILGLVFCGVIRRISEKK